MVELLSRPQHSPALADALPPRQTGSRSAPLILLFHPSNPSNAKLRVLCFVNALHCTSARLWFSLICGRSELLFLSRDLHPPFPYRLAPQSQVSCPATHHSRCPQPALLPPRRHRPTLHGASRLPTSKQPPSAQQHRLTLPRRQPTTPALMRPLSRAGPVPRSCLTSEFRPGQRREQTQLLVTIIVSRTGEPP